MKEVSAITAACAHAAAHRTQHRTSYYFTLENPSSRAEYLSRGPLPLTIAGDPHPVRYHNHFRLR